MATRTIYTKYTGSTALASIEIDYTYTQSTTNNTSTVTATAYAKRLHSGAYGYRNTPVNFALTIDGSVKNHAWTFNMGNVAVGSRIQITSHSKTIDHNDDGTHSNITISAYSATGTTTFEVINGSMSMGLDTIPRYAKITNFYIQDIRLDSFQLGFDTDNPVSLQQYKLNDRDWITFSNWEVIKNMVSVGSKNTIKIRVRSSASELWTESSSRTFSMLNLSKATIYEQSSFNVPFRVSIQRDNSNILHTVMMYTYNQNTEIFEKVAQREYIGESFNMILSTAEKDLMLKNRTNSKDFTYYIMLETHWDGYKGVTKSNEARMAFYDVEPTISGVTYKDINTSVQGVLNNNQKILRNKSTLEFKAGTATPKKWATIKSYRFTINGSTHTTNTSATTNVTKNVGTVNASADKVGTLTVIDSRGFSATTSVNVSILNYYEPQFINTDITRRNNYEERSYLVADNRRSIVKVNNVDVNVMDMGYRYKKTGASSYGGWVYLDTTKTSINGIYQNTKDNVYVGDFPNNESYDFEVVIRDKFTSWKRLFVTLTEGIALQQFRQRRIDFGVPIYDKQSNIKYVTDELPVVDTRDVDDSPKELSNKSFRADFKRNNKVGSPPVTASSSYSHIITLAGWSDSSGGLPSQLSVGKNGVAVRQGVSDTSWSSWVKLKEDKGYPQHGGNSTNWWTKYEDGTFVQTQKITKLVETTEYYGWHRAWVYFYFPIAFVNNDYDVNITLNGGSVFIIQGYNDTPTQAKGAVISPQARNSNSDFIIKATGRWK